MKICNFGLSKKWDWLNHLLRWGYFFLCSGFCCSSLSDFRLIEVCNFCCFLESIGISCSYSILILWITTFFSIYGLDEVSVLSIPGGSGVSLMEILEVKILGVDYEFQSMWE